MNQNIKLDSGIVLSDFLGLLQQHINEACEPIVQKAIKDCELQIKEVVARAAISMAQTANLDYCGHTLRIEVKFKEPK